MSSRPNTIDGAELRARLIASGVITREGSGEMLSEFTLDRPTLTIAPPPHEQQQQKDHSNG
jgi:hypothetical protein